MKNQLTALAAQKQQDIRDRGETVISNLSIPDIMAIAAAAKIKNEAFIVLPHWGEFGIDDKLPSFESFRQRFLEASGLPDVTVSRGHLIVWLKKPTLPRRAAAYLGTPPQNL
jgi:hypothetical protein